MTNVFLYKNISYNNNHLYTSNDKVVLNLYTKYLT